MAKKGAQSKKTLVIPDLIRNPVRRSNFLRGFFFSGSSDRLREKGKFLRRVAPEIYDSGFRVEPAMTRFLGFRRAWVGHRPAESVKVRICGAFAPER
jgi:hypothetical protein